MKISECLCPASLDSGILTLEDGTAIDLQHIYELLAELRDYAISATMTMEEEPSCVFAASLILDEFQ